MTTEQKLKNLAAEMAKLYNPKTAFGDRKLLALGRETVEIIKKREKAMRCDECNDEGMIECDQCGGSGYIECDHCEVEE